MVARSGTMTRGRAERPQLLPSGTGAFFLRRLAELAGLALLALAGAMLIAGATFDPADPSFNRALDGPVHNLLGRPGAYGAEFLLQSLGLAAALLPVVLASWAWQLLRRHGIGRWWLRMAAVPPLLILAGAMLAAAPVPEAWPLGDGLGGFAGALGLAQASLLTGLDPWMLAIAAAGLGLVALSYALGISRAGWRDALWALGRGLTVVGRGLLWLMLRIYALGRVLFALRRGRVDDPRREPRFTERDLPDDDEDEIDDVAEPVRPPRRAPQTVVSPKRSRVAPGKRSREANQGRFDFGGRGGYELDRKSVV